MHGGFQRGMERAAGVTLADATERMYRNGAFMRVYWEGAAIMLLADQRLRARTQGRQSLDTALDQLQRCCLSGEVGWRGRDLFGKLDELTGTTVFSELYQQHVGADNFPDIADAYRALGLRVTTGGDVVLLDDAPQRADRDAIMSSTGSAGATGTTREGAATPSPSDSN
jgi:predicted metalloprotease with PDZ domain